MLKNKKLLPVVLALVLMMSATATAFAQDTTTGESTALRTIQTATGTNETYWNSHDVKFEFTASADVTYNSSLGRYTMSSVTAGRPGVIVRAFSGANAITTIPSVQLTDGGRTAVLTTTATIQNATGYADDQTVTMFLYCNSTTGKISMSAY